MATGINTLRDGIETGSQPLPQGPNSFTLDHNEAPVEPGRSFLVGTHILPPGIDSKSSRDDAQPRDFDRDIRLERPDLSDTEQHARWRADLPPKELWRINPAKTEELLETPVDKLGLVNIRELITLGRSAVAERYEWDMSRTRNDHLFWPVTPYNWLAWKLDDELPVAFRNLPPNRIKLPLEFERWKHAITIPPDFPSTEVMRYSVDAWTSARDLYMSVRKAIVWERLRRNRVEGLLNGTSATVPRDPQDSDFERFYLGEVASHNKGAELSLERHTHLPPEFRILDPNDDAREILRLIGYQVRHHCRDGLKGRQARELKKVA